MMLNIFKNQSIDHIIILKKNIILHIQDLSLGEVNVLSKVSQPVREVIPW